MIRKSSMHEQNRSGFLSLLGIMKRGQKRRHQRQVNHVAVESSVVNTLVESLEDRTLLDASQAHYIFATSDSMEAFSETLDQPDSIQLTDRWETTATDGSGLGQGDPTTLTWTIVADGVFIDGFAGETPADSNLISFMDSLFGGTGDTVADRPWFTSFQSTFDRISSISGITYEYVTYDDGVDFATDADGILGQRADIRIGAHAMGLDGPLAYNFFPSFGGEMVFNSDLGSFLGNTLTDNQYLRNVIAHEAGHGVGIEHSEPINETKLMEPIATLAFDGHQFDDVLSLHSLYGDFNEKGDGNDTFQTATDTGTFVIGDAGTIGDDATDVPVDISDTDFISIDGTDDEDFYSFTVGDNVNISVQLTPLGPTYDQGPQGGTSASFDSTMQNDLSFEILGTDGVTVLATGDAGELGEAELVLNAGLPTQGTYFIRVFGAGNTTNIAQFYQLGAAFEEGPGVPQGPVVELNWGSTFFLEEAGTVDLIATLVDPVTGDPFEATEDVNITIDYSGVAIFGIDYFGPQNITIEEGSDSATITITAIDDLIRETPESVIAEILFVSGATEVGNEKVTTEIIEGVSDEPLGVPPTPAPTVELSISDVTMAENGGTAVVTASLNIASIGTTIIYLGYTGTATLGVDYTGAVITIGNGQLTGSVTLTAIDDLIDEPDETIIVDVLPNSNPFNINYIEKDGFQQVSAIIIDDDVPYPVVTLTSDVTSIAEYWGIVTYTATLDRIYGTDTTIDFAVTGDAIRGTDFGIWITQIMIPAGQLTGQFQAQAIHDLIPEEEEIFTVTVSTVNGFAQDGTEFINITINDDDLIKPNVTLAANPASIAEYWGVATFTVSLDMISIFDTTINIGYSGTATNGVDYGSWANQVVIPAGQLSGQIQIQAIPDSIVDGDETVIVSILSVVNGTESGVQESTVTIIDDDIPNISLSTDLSTVDEYWKIVNIIATTDRISTSDIRVTLGYSGTATNGVDYGVWEPEVVIPAGQLTGQIQLQTIDDPAFEGDETVVIDVTAVANGAESGTQQATVIIQDKNAPEVSLSVNQTNIKEYWGVPTFTLTQNVVSSLDTTVNLKYTGTASVGTDYGAWAYQVVIPAGELSVQFQIQAIPDNQIEPNESVSVSIKSIMNATIKDGKQSATVLIDNDDSGATTIIDPVTSKKAVVVSGTTGDDVIRVRQLGTDIQVSMNTVDLGIFTGAEVVIVDAGDGNDTIILEDSVTLNAYLSGGKGNDSVTGGSGNDVIKGNEGNDVLKGGALGKDVFIGGDGADIVNSSPSTTSSSSTDGDLMIAGISPYEQELNNLFAIQQEWTSSNAFVTRVSNLKNGTGGVPIIDSTTVLNDSDLDELFSTKGQDWFLFTTGQDIANSVGGDLLN